MLKCKCGKIIPMKYFIKTKLLYTLGLKYQASHFYILKKYGWEGIDYSHNIISLVFYMINALK